MSNRTETALAAALAKKTQANAELESIWAELKMSWELEAESQVQIKKAQAELEGIPPNLTYPFASLFSPSVLYSAVFSAPGRI